MEARADFESSYVYSVHERDYDGMVAAMREALKTPIPR